VNNKNYYERFINSKPVKEFFSNEIPILSKDQEIGLRNWFDLYDPRKSRDWFKQIARWISVGVSDFVGRRAKLEELGIYSMNEETFDLRYADDGKKYSEWMSTRAQIFSISYWIERGLTAEEAIKMVSEIQKKNASKVRNTTSRSCRSKSYYERHGIPDEEATERIRIIQSRDLDFFVTKYGDYGKEKYDEMCQKRRKSWLRKDKYEHGKRTSNSSSYNEYGHEARAIRSFIQVNNLGRYRCMYGAPRSQFYQNIPSVGFRRYDLAVFDGETLIIVMEFHGPHHINFSDFCEEIRNERMRDKHGKLIRSYITYGETHDNDIAKRNKIITTFPNCEYIVIWTEDLRIGNFELEYLRKPFKDRISS